MNWFNKYLVATFLSERSAVFRLAIFAGLLLFCASVAHSQTVAEVAKLPEAQQREIIMRFVNNSIANLPSHTDRNGKPKSAEEYTRDRTLANLVRALFIQDPKRPQDVPEGPRVMLIRIKKYSTETPNRTVLDVMSELVGWSFQHFYTDFYTSAKKAEYAKKSDADQEAYFRMNISLYENDQRYDRMIKALEEREAELKRHLQEIYDDAVILADGRHVMLSEQGDFIVSSSPTDYKSDYKLEDRYYPEAQYLYDCMKARGIKNGQEGRAACVTNKPSKPAPTPASAVDNRSMTPDDNPIGEGGFITPYHPPR